MERASATFKQSVIISKYQTKRNNLQERTLRCNHVTVHIFSNVQMMNIITFKLSHL